MTKVFRERFPEAEVVNAEFVDFADAVSAARKQIPEGAAATAESRPGDAGDEAAETKAKRDSTAAASGGAIGVVTFNSVFGNLWSQRLALERAADILEVSGQACWHSVNQEYPVSL